jgi:hypothetical protein
MSDTIHIDAFQANLHGARILCQGPFVKGRLPPILESIESLRAPFKRKVLLTNKETNPFALSKTFQFQYDAVFQMGDTADWSLALTYMLHAPKDVLVVAEDIFIPDAVWARLTKNITFIHVTATPLKLVHPYEAIFFAKVEDLAHPYVDTVYKAVLGASKKAYTQAAFKEVLQELRIASAGLVWLKETNSLSWYDPVGLELEPLSKKQLSELFLWLSTYFT